MRVNDDVMVHVGYDDLAHDTRLASSHLTVASAVAFELVGVLCLPVVSTLTSSMIHDTRGAHSSIDLEC